VQFKYKKKVKEAYMPEYEIEKNVWVVKSDSGFLKKSTKGKHEEFRDAKGTVIVDEQEKHSVHRIFR
jgi:hypothetical protein